MSRKACPSDVSDEEWALIAPYLILTSKNAPQREYSMREVFNDLRSIARTGAPRRMMAHDLPPRQTVYQQAQRCIKAGVLAAVAADLRGILRIAAGKKAQPTAVIFDCGSRPSRGIIIHKIFPDK